MNELFYVYNPSIDKLYKVHSEKSRDLILRECNCCVSFNARPTEGMLSTSRVIYRKSLETTLTEQL